MKRAALLLAAAMAWSVAWAADYATWKDYGGSADSMQYSSLQQITKANAGQMELAWG